MLNISIKQWQASSWLYRLVGILGPWRDSSVLLQWAEGIGALLIGIVLVLGPFVSTSLIGVLLFACGCYWILLTISDKQKLGVTSIHLLVLLYWCIATLAVAFSPVKIAAFAGWTKLTLYLLMFALMARILRSPQIRNYLITILLLLSLIVSGYGIRQEFFGAEQLATWNDPTSTMAGDTRVYSYLENPNLLAGYLLPLIALSIAAVFMWQRWLPKALAITMVVVNCSCLYFTDSRGGWIGMMALTLTFLLLLTYWYRAYLPWWFLPVVGGGLLTVLILAVIVVEPLRVRLLSIFAGRGDSSNNFRINVWSSVIEMIRDRPVLGIGPGNSAFNKIYPLYMRPKFTALSAYSIYLETAVETGFVGFACLLWMLFTAFSRGIKNVVKLNIQGNVQGFWLIAAIAGMVGMLAHGVVDTVWYRPQINVLWWMMVALIASYYFEEDS